jgi:triphosphatase
VAANDPDPKADAKEIELKLEFEADAAQRILANPILESATTQPRIRELISIYYDTGAEDLRNAGVFLRVRSMGDGYVQTIKSAKSEAEFFERNEWECPVPTHAPDLNAAAGTALAPLLTPEVRANLKPRFHTRFRRKSYDIHYGGAEIELAVDEGEATAGVKAAPISELELELKTGDKSALFTLARELAATVPLSLAVKTKAERGFELLDGGDYAVEKARPVIVTPEMTSSEAFRSISRNCLRQIVANAPAMREGRVEALHQMRVGLRRFRAAIALFGRMLDGSERESVKNKLRWITQELGPARDLDVFAADVLEPLRAAHPGNDEIEEACREFKERHAAAYARAIQSASSEAFRAALLDIAAWIETGDWARKNAKLAEAPVRPYALKELARLRRGVKSKGRGLRQLSSAKRHRLRIRAKRLRYATEFFAATFPGKESETRRKESLAALEAMQDALGLLNDMATRKGLLATGEGDSRLRAPAIDTAEEEKWLSEAERAYGRFASAKAFWKA